MSSEEFHQVGAILTRLGYVRSSTVQSLEVFVGTHVGEGFSVISVDPRSSFAGALVSIEQQMRAQHPLPDDWDMP